RGSGLPAEPACTTLTPASAGGPLPESQSVLVLRWLGTASYELAFRRQVLLLDAFYDRGPRYRPIGIGPADVRRANAILVGHAHYDHVSDAPEIARRTGAMVVGAPPTAAYLRTAAVPPAQIRMVKGGDVLDFGGFTVEAVHANHSEFPPGTAERSRAAFATIYPDTLTEAERKHEAEVTARGSRAPEIRTEGTFAFLFSFEDGFRLVWTDSPGAVSAGERQVMAKLGKVNALLLAYQGPQQWQDLVAQAMARVQLYRPDILIPGNHDERPGFLFDAPLDPLFLVAREALPGIRTIAPLYRTPICIDVKSREVFVGR
ncbi:MAG: MBL fold metallo-hydrolase, partial [Gemmatimonadetes bacterium]|nr:MBL fold metallo-hydrolase [Gemmatimonadota bacterium]